jgi:ABC-type glycerol-3-phosphate transport system substrate-binding protein
MKHWYRWLVVAIVVLTLVPLASCQKGGDIGSVKLGQEKIELEFWHTKTGSQQELLDLIVAEFNATNEYNIQVNPTLIEGSYDQIFKETVAGLAVGEVPDLVVAYPSMVAEYMEAGAPLDLTPYVDDDTYGLTEAEFNDIYPVYIEDNSYPAYEGKMLSWPFHKSMLIMFANVSLLNEVGVTSLPETWDDFYAACQAVKQNTDADTCWSIHIDASDVDGLMASVGVYPQADPATLESKVNDPKFVEFMQFIQKMANEGLARIEAERYSGDDEMTTNDAVFTSSSSSGIEYFPRNEDGTFAIDWAVISLPHAAGQDPASTVYGANIMAVKEDDPERDLAKWLFIKYWTSYDMVKRWVMGTDEIRGSSYMSLLRSMQNDPEFQAYLSENPRYAEAVALLETGVIEPQLAGQQAVRDILEDAYIKVINGEDVQATLDEAAALATEAFKRKGGQ